MYIQYARSGLEVFPLLAHWASCPRLHRFPGTKFYQSHVVHEVSTGSCPLLEGTLRIRTSGHCFHSQTFYPSELYKSSIELYCLLEHNAREHVEESEQMLRKTSALFPTHLFQVIAAGFFSHPTPQMDNHTTENPWFLVSHRKYLCEMKFGFEANSASQVFF